MADADENDDAQAQDSELERDEEQQPGTEGDEPGGEDTAGRDEEGDLPAQRAGAGDDAGTSPARGAAQPEAEQRTGRVQRLANENREYRERLERLERSHQEERERWQRQQNQISEQQERDRLALMTPDERVQYLITQDRQQRQTEMQQMRLQNALQMDKSAYDAKAQVNPVYRRMQDQVEAMFQEQMRKGQPTDRETILYHLIGRQAVNGAGSSKSRQQARRRVEGQRVAPSSGKGDTARQTGTSRVSTVEDRLKDVLI